MARFLKAPQQQFVDMGGAPNVNFYTNLIDKSQDNLERSIAAKQQAIQYYNNLPFHSKEDYDAVVGKAQKELETVLSEDFPSLGRVVNTIMNLNNQLAPGIQALKRKDEQIKIAQEGKLRLGTNWIGNEISDQPIVDAAGNFVDPNSFEAKYYNADDIRKNFIISQGARLMETIEGDMVQGDKPGFYKRTTKFGKDTPTKLGMYGKDSPYAKQIAEELLSQMPEGFIEVSGGREQALDKVMELGLQAAFSPEFAYKETTQDIGIPGYGNKEPRGKTTSLLSGLNAISRQYVIEGKPKVSSDDLIKIQTEYLQSLQTGKPVGTSTTDYINLRKQYPALYQQALQESSKVTAKKGLSEFQKQGIVISVFMDLVNEKNQQDSKYAETRAEVPTSEIPQFHQFLNNVPDTWEFEDEDGKKYKKEDLLTDDKKSLISDYTSGSPTQIPLSKDYVMVYHEGIGKNLKIPKDALDVGVQQIGDFVNKAREIDKNNAINSAPVSSRVPTAIMDNGDGTTSAIYPVVYKRDGKSYMSYAIGTSKGLDVDYNLETPLEEAWGDLNALKLKSMQDAYGNPTELKYPAQN